MLAAQGVKEFVLISQDTTTYGSDLGLKDGLAKLVDSIAAVPGVEWVRFLYCYPTAITDELLDVMASRPNVCKYFDIPLQHASRRVLQRMRRGGNREGYERMINRIREGRVAFARRSLLGFPANATRTSRNCWTSCAVWSSTTSEYSLTRMKRTLPPTSLMKKSLSQLRKNASVA